MFSCCPLSLAYTGLTDIIGCQQTSCSRKLKQLCWSEVFLTSPLLLHYTEPSSSIRRRPLPPAPCCAPAQTKHHPPVKTQEGLGMESFFTNSIHDSIEKQDFSCSGSSAEKFFLRGSSRGTIIRPSKHLLFKGTFVSFLGALCFYILRLIFLTVYECVLSFVFCCEIVIHYMEKNQMLNGEIK